MPRILRKIKSVTGTEIGDIVQSLIMSQTTGSGSAVQITNSPVTIKTSGGPVSISVIPFDDISGQFIGVSSTNEFAGGVFELRRDGTPVAKWTIDRDIGGITDQLHRFPSNLEYEDSPGVGTFTYTLHFATTAGTAPVIQIESGMLRAKEVY